MAQIHELNTESNVGVGLDFVTDNGESTGKVGFAALAGGVLEKYEETELAGKRRSVKRAIDDLAQQVDDAVEGVDDLTQRVTELKKAGSGLTDDAKQALLTCFRNVAWINDSGQSYYDALEDALYPPIRAASITLNTDTVKLKTLGATQQLTATVLPADATDKVVWASSDTSVTTVVDGLVTSVAYGSATITATAGNVSATASVLVAQAEVTGIIAVFEQGGATIYDTASLDDLKPMLTVTASYDDGTSQTVTDYTLSGTLTEGTSVVTVSYGGKTATFTVTVTSSAISNPYLSSDMTLWLDGIYNTSTGHDSTATSWEDLIGNILFENNGITIDSDGMVFNGTAGNGFIGTMPSAPKTIEVVLSVSDPTVTQAVINGFGNTSAGNVTIKGSSLLEKRGNYSSLGKNSQAISTGVHTYSFVDGIGQYLDGESASVTTVNISMSNSGSMTIGNALATAGGLAKGSGGYPLTGKIHCIRFYSDELTAAEIAANAAVDATRFNIS